MNANLGGMRLLIAAFLLGGPCLVLSQTTTPTTLPTGSNGVLLSVTDNILLVDFSALKDKSQQAKIIVDQNVQLVIDGVTGTPAQLTPGMRIMPISQPATRLRPAALQVNAFSEATKGRLVKVEQNQVTLAVDRPGADPVEIRIATNAATKVIVYKEIQPGQYAATEGSLAEVAANSNLSVIVKEGVATRISTVPPPRAARGR